jgi:hypothetical protein
MRNFGWILALGLFMAALADEDKDSTEKPIMECGGLVAVDYAAPADSFGHRDLHIGKIELQANVNVGEELVAAILLKAENRLDSLWIEQAMVSYKPAKIPAMELLFGQLTFNHGVLATRLISDPLISDEVELIKPGAVLNYSAGKFKPGIGLTTIRIASEDTNTHTVNESNGFAAVVNIDYNFNDESMIRLSSLMDSAMIDADLAASAVYREFALDAEIYSRFDGWGETGVSGFFAALSYELAERLSLGIRYDGFSEESFKDLTHRLGLGAKLEISHGAFCAIEFGHIKPPNEKAYQEIAAQLGLESTIKLPGFQRKTLTRE